MESVLPRIVFETVFAESYLQTKHKNLRCFPRCAVLHAEQRFCGRPIHAKVILTQADEPTSLYTVFGELRNEAADPLFEIGDECTKNTLEKCSGRVVLGQSLMRCAGEDENSCRFAIPPPRKWHYPGRIKDTERHLYQLYLVKQEKIVGTVTSSPFQIHPVWKNEKADSSRATLSSSSSSQSTKQLKDEKMNVSNNEEDESEPKGTKRSKERTGRMRTPPSQTRRLKSAPASETVIAEVSQREHIRTPPEQRRQLNSKLPAPPIAESVEQRTAPIPPHRFAPQQPSSVLSTSNAIVPEATGMFPPTDAVHRFEMPMVVPFQGGFLPGMNTNEQQMSGNFVHSINNNSNAAHTFAASFRNSAASRMRGTTLGIGVNLTGLSANSEEAGNRNEYGSHPVQGSSNPTPFHQHRADDPALHSISTTGMPHGLIFHHQHPQLLNLGQMNMQHTLVSPTTLSMSNLVPTSHPTAGGPSNMLVPHSFSSAFMQPLPAPTSGMVLSQHQPPRFWRVPGPPQQ